MTQSTPSATTNQPRYFHGGPPHLKVGMWILPADLTGVPSTKRYGGGDVVRTDRVYVTTEFNAALIFAAFHPSMRGRVYEVEPYGELVHDPDCDKEGLSFECEKARIIKAIDPPKHVIKEVRMTIIVDEAMVKEKRIAK